MRALCVGHWLRFWSARYESDSHVLLLTWSPTEICLRRLSCSAYNRKRSVPLTCRETFLHKQEYKKAIEVVKCNMRNHQNLWEHQILLLPPLYLLTLFILVAWKNTNPDAPANRLIKNHHKCGSQGAVCGRLTDTLSLLCPDDIPSCILRVREMCFFPLQFHFTEK